MKIQSFLKYVEIQTKAASIIPFMAGAVLAYYRYRSFSIENFFLMLISLLSFDMATTAINNYIDFKSARKKSGFGYERHNAIVRDNIKESTAVAVIVVLLLVASSTGFCLFLKTDYVVLVLGAVSFLVGILYSAGPVPISRTPFGELFSGLFMGFLIPFIAVYIQVPDESLLSLSLINYAIIIKVNILDVLSVLLCSVPLIIGIANIMLANNICDMEDDLENNRYTLALYIGKEKALFIFNVLYYIAYFAVILAIILKILPYTSLLFILTFIPIRKNVKLFLLEQSKKETFSLSVKNFAIMNITLIITVIMAFVTGGIRE